jgi:endonuclease/exonuclease/phosphatase (EEP) superfamily protein YafD
VTLIRARVRGRELHLLQTDIYALPGHYRGTALRRLGEIARASADAPVIILGDFNTPRNSHFFQDWRAGGLRNAFEAAGHGYAATWPSPLPVLSLDQIWFNSRLRAVRSEHVTSWSSDHRAVVAEFDFVP